MSVNITGYFVLLATQAMCEYSQCYDDDNICLWTNGSSLTKYAAQSACVQRDSFLSRIPNSNIQFKLEEFRSAAGNLFGDNGFWIDVRAVSRDNFHWIDGSPLAGSFSTLLYTTEVLRIDCSSMLVSSARHNLLV